MSTKIAPVKRWEATRLQNLVRNCQSGRYYARLFRDGKEVWKSLKTSHFSVAEARLANALKEHREKKSKKVDPSNARMTFGQASALHEQRLNEKVCLKRRTRIYVQEVRKALLKSWPELAAAEIRRLTPAACREWAAGYARKMGATRYNAAISLLRQVLELAVESGVIYSNPASDLHRKPARAKKLELPTRAQFAAFVAEMRKAHSRDSQNCADLTEGLAFTGMRIGESWHIEWRDLDFAAGEIIVRGDPEEATKNGEIRRVPLIAEAQALFQRLRKERLETPRLAKVFLVRECQKAINRAAKITSMTRITHHDLRHFFATVCIESGVDIPTVSRWLGHKDGGALAMKTYGHLRREHSLAQAQKVSFSPLAAVHSL